MARKRTAQTHPDSFGDVDALVAGMDHLRLADDRLAPLIATFGPPDRLLSKTTSCFSSLAKSIIYQQLAGSAAAAIYSRFLAACGVPDESHLTPAAVLAAPLPALRACGLSERKASYIVDLAAHFADGRLSDELLTSVSDAELLERLTAVRGIGPWTVDMFAMFHLGHPNILPVGDLGVRKGLAHLCGLQHLPSPAEMEELTAAWQPYRSLGCYYMWRIPLPPQPSRRNSSGKPANGKAKGTAGSKAQQAKAGVPAAVSSFVDVGVDPAAPMQATAGIRSSAQPAAAHGTTAAVLPGGGLTPAAAAAGGAADVPLVTPVKPINPAAFSATHEAAAAAAAAGSAGHACSTQPYQVQPLGSQQPQRSLAFAMPQGDSQQLLAVEGSASAASAAAASEAAAAGVMTRRRLRWAQQAAAAAAAAATGPGAAGGGRASAGRKPPKGYKARIVDL